MQKNRSTTMSRHTCAMRLLAAIVVAAGVLSLAWQPVHAAVLTASDGAGVDRFGHSVSLSGTTGLVGAYWDDIGSTVDQGSAYVFRNLGTANGTVNEQVKLVASDGAGGDSFGWSVSLSGTTGLVGAVRDTIGSNTAQGSAYVFRNLGTATGTVNENAKLTASDGARSDQFGRSVSLSGTIGLIGAYSDDIGANRAQGSAYVFRNLDTATGTVTQHVKLVASDGAADDSFGSSVSLSGTIGLVGAYADGTGASFNQGSAYVFRNLHTASGTVTQHVKLTAFDTAEDDYFGHSVSLSGTIGLVGAYQDDIGPNSDQGSAYVFRNLHTASGTVNQNVKLVASDGARDDDFGYSVSLSGTTGLIGAYSDDIGASFNQGSAYVFRNLDTASLTVTQHVKLVASDGAGSDSFGSSVSLAGDAFTIGAFGKNLGTGRAYTGTVSSVTTLDEGNASRTIDGISFISRDDWIIGQTTSDNQVTLLAGNTGDVTAAGKAVYVGQNAGSNDNTLVIAGTLTASQVNVGTAGNTGNMLLVNGTLNGGGTVTVASNATLAGAGFIVGNVVNAGLFSPGNSPGVMSITGNLLGSGDYLMEIESLSSFDQINLTGALSFNDSIIRIDLGGYTPVLDDSFDLFDFAGTIGGSWSFDFTQAPLTAGLTWDTNTFATTGSISVVPEPSVWFLGGLATIGLSLLRLLSIPTLGRK
ncbi:MAG: FG-GAP repeat protein [Pirellulales bacterium]|nr:FG-GAP repeat protein [Pirellulales bacterium]